MLSGLALFNQNQVKLVERLLQKHCEMYSLLICEKISIFQKLRKPRRLIYYFILCFL